MSRLIEVGGCDASDWRLRLILNRVRRKHRRILNLPRLAKIYATLGVREQMEHLSKFLYKKLPKYEPSQLAVIAHAFGTAHLQDKYLFVEIAKWIEPNLSVLS